jgi:GNAT superfamily N-acetyltransferase
MTRDNDDPHDRLRRRTARDESRVPCVNVQVVRYADRPELDASWDDVVGSAWPAFMLHDPTVNELWGLLYDEAPDCQLYLLDRDTGEVLAHGNSIPVAWDGSLEDLPDDGIDGVLRRVASARDDVGGRRADVLCAMQAVVKPSARARGLSRRIVEAMREVARGRGLGALIAPVRPTEKSRYPLTPMERYVGWRREDGLPHDPWLRVHERVGAELLAIAPRSMSITGTVAEWEEWTGMAFPDTDLYVVPGALVPVAIDRARDEGAYVEPNVWMRHAAT